MLLTIFKKLLAIGFLKRKKGATIEIVARSFIAELASKKTEFISE